MAGGRGDVRASCSCRSSSICRSSIIRRSSISTWARLLALAIGLTTMGMMLVAIGLFLSALTRNQIIAAIWTFVVLFLMVVVVPLVFSFGLRQHTAWADGVAVRRPALPDSEASGWGSSTCATSRFIFRSASSCST